MGPRKGRIRRSEETRLKSTSIETTLYDLIGAVQEVLPREEEKMVTLVVCNLLGRSPARWQNVPRKYGRIGAQGYERSFPFPAGFLETAG